MRLRTERLELRLPTEEELVQLAHVAERGVHPPDEMPFMTAWTDGIGKPEFVDSFVEFHLTQRREWRPDAWHLLLGVWAEGELAGSQGAELRAPGTAETGSWLGQAFQGRGNGTEMRTAILELFFRGLGGDVATSGALEGNLSSARVSAKLGYESAGEEFVSPRGEPVRAERFRLRRERWQPPFPVEIVGLERCLPLFGL